MASSQSPNRVYFTSFDRQPTDINTDFTITFDSPIQNAYNFEVVQASFPNLLKPFARYETILYIYHESFNSGNIAIGIPMSTSLFSGATGEALPVTAGREEYIDKRFFADGTDLATYLTAWIQSLDVSWPAAGTGLQPFFYPNDDPYGTPTFLGTNTSGITFANLAFTYDDLTGNGTLKLTLADSTPLAVRVASTFDYGDLNLQLPSQLGYKLGYTIIQPESFGPALAVVTTANNQFTIGAAFEVTQITAANNTFVVYATSNSDIATIVTIPEGAYDLNELCDVLQIVLNQAKNFPPYGLSFDAFVSPSGTDIQIGLNSLIVGESWNIDFTSQSEFGFTGITLGFGAVDQVGTSSFNNFTAPAPPVVTNVFQETTVTIPPNDYTVGGLTSSVEQAIANLPVPFKLLFQGTAVVDNAGAIEFNFASGVSQAIKSYAVNFGPQPIQQAAKTLLGFVADENVVAGTTLTAPNIIVVGTQTITPDYVVANDPINLTRTSLIYFASSLSSGESLASAGRKDILFAVAMTAGLGQIQQFQSSLSGILVNRPPSTIRNIRVTLLDDNFQVLEPIPQNAAIVAEIHFAYNEDATASKMNKVSTNLFA
jgi:hypothetical protein